MKKPTDPIVLEDKKSKKKIVIGHYDGINGKDSIPLDNVKPTMEEVKAIVRHHAELCLSVDQSFAMGQTGSWEIRQLPYSSKRLDYYANIIGEESVQNILDDVYGDFTYESFQEDMEGLFESYEKEANNALKN